MGQQKKILELAREKGIIRAMDVEALGISRNYLYRMHKAGLLERCAVGLYKLTEAPVNENFYLAEIAKRLPRAVICLVSALSYHGLTTQIPHEIWLTIPRASWLPHVDYPPVNLTYVSGLAYSFGIQEHVINGVSVRIYSPAKTVADCFKFRSKVGLDVAIEALREAWRSRKVTMDELVEAAGVDRVSKIMRPYLEAVV
ncbi:type IV toxin-antitoxin system AbiEi family antitoxin domain-containing protein [Desulfobotulus mexicanus]|uniref:Transcriptional regulator n=1 Tax=Desulfobotulus mexicanus TaxID=2586642 RepID=A0A5Q4VEB7_9BACT|nr:type IV toxin-antitoxin system AbiEi family antitoxin domain-containing protein [Desulfobotulus mexicanus]TYT76034.1 transcriptional regulator [Desulfobotulus mexicanus]